MSPDFSKSKDGLIPAIVQDNATMKVLMLGYMNNEAFEATKKNGRVCFFSRSKGRLWVKGEESGNFLDVVHMELDCDRDTLLVQAKPAGPVCHTGTDTCWGDANTEQFGFLSELEAVIAQRRTERPEGSYVTSLFEKGINKIAQKVGEEAVETVIEAKDDNEELFLNESADLLFHYLILLQAKGYTLSDISKVLKERHS
ncbi:bifunctional phosphoribosyl-AMP cyclohydrolase/phosphoribosyl-ATP diphosphatase HisIE [Robertkochia sediminum]|uniref:bifunctional phosphoribosyl-AMP cyclohydrolase/phosphoribosyl-ATP diphosphatase HisIE n=1 Tax=Robertkochia sediminum TaxID=2785326 RepID=UPI00193173E3|nr:bifunctional phosphoribosyl-AMP cyclohydrolase/phosphoribosyl-ATP diphosphatase HisIE [Robertkochia sediminum]MBL7473541.1 bifunctional phosphoribosyl-AMP cyclohydrolase/phosphoribosyl-ATP diphosphatase HisIE [Robertkochia sediminum]